MSTQRDLFRPMCGRTRTKQQELFAAGHQEISNVYCGECGRAMIRTPSGWIACPSGHGKLREESKS